MLGKLIKHEWKSIYKMGSLMLLAMLVVTLLGCVVLRMPWVVDLISDEGTMGDVQSVILMLTMVISFILYIFLLVGVSYGIMIYLGVNFYKSMYSQQGYLTNTLPVTPNQLLFSKTLVAGIWYLLIEVAVCVSIFALVWACLTGIANSLGTYGGAEFWKELGEEIELVFQSELGSELTYFIVYMVLAVLITPFATMITLFAALTIGQLSSKHKALIGVLAYFGICIANTVIVSIVQVISTMKFSMESIANPNVAGTMNMTGSYNVTLVLQVVVSVVLYWAAHKILSTKLNME